MTIHYIISVIYQLKTNSNELTLCLFNHLKEYSTDMPKTEFIRASMFKSFFIKRFCKENKAIEIATYYRKEYVMQTN